MCPTKTQVVRISRGGLERAIGRFLAIDVEEVDGMLGLRLHLAEDTRDQQGQRTARSPA
jgi:hypothetical protein